MSPTSSRRASSLLLLASVAVLAPACGHGSGARIQRRALATAGGYACVIKADATLWCWGANPHGQLGDGLTHQTCQPLPGYPSYDCSPTPVQVQGLRDVTGIATGMSHACALRGDGGVWCWGDNAGGQLGNALPSSREPVQVSGIDHVQAIAAGDAHTCAVKQDGTVWCWGSNAMGQLGDQGSPGSAGLHGDCDPSPSYSSDCTHAPVQAFGLSGAVAVTAGHDASCALTEDGGVWCWGNDGGGQLGDGRDHQGPVLTPSQISGFSGMVAISARSARVCAVRDDGFAWCWGEILGSVPQWVNGLQGAVDIAPDAFDYTCARVNDGTVRCWGLDGSGEIGRGHSSGDMSGGEVVSVPALVKGLTRVTEVVSDSSFSCALDEDGAVWCWGANPGLFGADFHAEGTNVNGVGWTSTPVRVTGLP